VLGKPDNSQTCITCHGDHNVARPATRGTELCASCHEAEVKQFAASAAVELAQASGVVPPASAPEPANSANVEAVDVPVALTDKQCVN